MPINLHLISDVLRETSKITLLPLCETIFASKREEGSVVTESILMVSTDMLLMVTVSISFPFFVISPKSTFSGSHFQVFLIIPTIFNLIDLFALSFVVI